MASEDPGLKREIVTLTEDIAKELSAVLESCTKGELLSRFEGSLKVLNQNRGVSEVRVARDKLIVVLETLEYFKEQVGPEEQQDLRSVCTMCFRELSVSMSVLERAFVDSLEGNRLHKVLKELILKMDSALMEVKRKNIELINFGSEDVKREVNAFFNENVNDDSEEGIGGDGQANDALQKKLIELQMQLMSKNQMLESYAEEIDKLNSRIRQLGGGDGSNFDINAIYTEIENLNKTIEVLKKENGKLRASINAFAGDEEQSTKHDPKRDVVESMVDKITTLQKRINSGQDELETGVNAKGRQAQRMSELDNEIHKLTRQVIDHEEEAKTYKKEIELLELGKNKIQDNLNRLIEDHENLKAKSLDLLKKNTQIEAENDILRKEKSHLVDSILALQKSHQDELQSLRTTLDSLGEKLNVAGLDVESKQTLAEMETRHSTEKKSWTDKHRSLQDSCESLQSEVQTLEFKIDEQHQVISTYRKLESTLLSEQKRIKELEEELERLEESHSNLEAERDDALSRIRSLERELHQTKEEREKHRESAEDLGKDKSELMKDKEELHQRIKEIEEDIRQTRERLRNAESEKRSHERTLGQVKQDSLRTNDILKLSKEEISNLQETINEKRRELELSEKDRSFLKKKVERLEDQLFQKEKKYLRDEAEREVDTESRTRKLIEDNECLKEELIILERANSRLFNDLEFQKAAGGQGGDHKLKSENERLRELFKRSESNWLKERQNLLDEIKFLRDQADGGFRSMRPERDQDFATKEGKFLSTYGSANSRSSPTRGIPMDSTQSKSKKNFS